MADRNKPGVAFWVTVVVVVVLVAYPLSLWPAWRFWALLGQPKWLLISLQRIYAPLWAVAPFVPGEFEAWAEGYCNAGAWLHWSH
jgi:hypothetical protein